MKENKDQQKKVSTCFEGSPCAEMMQKIMGEEGIGSLCQEMMRSFVRICQGEKEGPEEAPNRKAGEKDNDLGSRASENENEDQTTGGVK